MTAGLWDMRVCTPLDISDKIGIPLVIASLELALSWRGRKDEYTSNALLASFDPKAFGYQVGTVVVASKDGKGLHPAHVEALASYVGTLYEEQWVPQLRVGTGREEGRKVFGRREGRLCWSMRVRGYGGFRLFWMMWWDMVGRERYSGDGGVVGTYEV
jgi:hypothetical protein